MTNAGGGASLAAPMLWMPVVWSMLTRGQSLDSAVATVLGGLAASAGPLAGGSGFVADVATALLATTSRPGSQYLMMDVDAGSLGGLASPPAAQSSSSESSFLSEEGGEWWL